MHYLYLEHIKEAVKGSTIFTKINRTKNHILPYFGKMKVHDITSENIFSWKEIMNKAKYQNGKKLYSLAYKKGLLLELRTLLEYGVDFCGLKENVARKVCNFRKNIEAIDTGIKIRYITPLEYNLFTSVIDKLLYKTFFAFLYYMGVRKGEAQALNWEDIDFKKRKVRIIKTITNKTDELDENGFKFKITNTKNGKNRNIKMPKVLKRLLLELYQYYSEFIGFNNQWFVFGGRRHLPSQTIDDKKDYYFDLANKTYETSINRITNHEFRHSHASFLISKGVKIERIAFRLGDTIAVVQEVYAHLFPETEDEIIEELDLIEQDCNINLYIKKEFCKTTQKLYPQFSVNGT